MQIQGSLERILDSVLPHEVNHTIFACHFRRPLPRWADEGAATIVEHESEKRRQRLLNRQVMGTNKRIPLRRLLSMTEYPEEMQQVLTLYAEGYSLADFLLQRGGRKRYLMFLQDAHKNGWDEAVAKMYQFKNVDELEQNWGSWIIAGSPDLNQPAGQQLASNQPEPATENKDLVIRSQSPDQEGPLQNEADFAAADQNNALPLDQMASEENSRRSRPLPIDSRVPFSGRPAAGSQPAEDIALVQENQRRPRTSLHQESQQQPARYSAQPQRAANNSRPQRPAANPRYQREQSPGRGIDLGQSAEIDF